METNLADLTDEQREVVQSVLNQSNDNRMLTVGGFAGTGKTVVVRFLAERLKTFAVCTFTGKAADVLRKRGVENASTIHSLIYVPREEKLANGKRILRFDLKDPDDVECEGFLVDEASMIYKKLYDDLMSLRKPVVFVGDHGQLPPVGSVDINLMAQPNFRLETVHRNAGEIPLFAEWLRNGNQSWTYEGPRERVKIIPRWDDPDLIAAGQVICAYNKTRVGINERVRGMLGFTKPYPMPGEKIICLQNRRKYGLLNGMQGSVIDIAPGARTLSVRCGDRVLEDVPYVPEQFGCEKTVQPENVSAKELNNGPVPFDFAYCITCHKAQGDEWTSVLVIEQYPKFDMWPHKRWAYTAASRAKKRLIWACS